MDKKFVVEWIETYCKQCPKKDNCTACQVKRMVKVFEVFA